MKTMVFSRPIHLIFWNTNRYRIFTIVLRKKHTLRPPWNSLLFKFGDMRFLNRWTWVECHNLSSKSRVFDILPVRYIKRVRNVRWHPLDSMVLTLARRAKFYRTLLLLRFSPYVRSIRFLYRRGRRYMCQKKKTLQSTKMSCLSAMKNK